MGQFMCYSDCSFLSKTIIAEEAGAVAVIIMDNDVNNDDMLIDMLEDGTDRSTHIPAFFLHGKDGWGLLVALSLHPCYVYWKMSGLIIVGFFGDAIKFVHLHGLSGLTYIPQTLRLDRLWPNYHCARARDLSAASLAIDRKRRD